MNLTAEHLRASYEIYMKYGNSSSATILSVLNKLRESEGKEQVVACAFGPGIALEMMVMRRRKESFPQPNGCGLNGANGISTHHPTPSHDGVVANGDDISRTNGDPIVERSVDHRNHHAGSGADGSVADGEPAVYSNGVDGSASILPTEDLD